MTRNQKLVLLASLYLSQGLPFGFLTQAVPVLLRQAGASLTSIGDTSILMLPWLLKVLWAPQVDRWWSARVGRRRSWILPMQGLTVLTLLGLAAADPAVALDVARIRGRAEASRILLTHGAAQVQRPSRR